MVCTICTNSIVRFLKFIGKTLTVFVIHMEMMYDIFLNYQTGKNVIKKGHKYFVCKSQDFINKGNSRPFFENNFSMLGRYSKLYRYILCK